MDLYEALSTIKQTATFGIEHLDDDDERVEELDAALNVVDQFMYLLRNGQIPT